MTEDARHREVVCPFCGLGCDDLTLSPAGGGFAVDAGGCPISAARFALVVPPAAGARVAGAEVAPGQAIARAAALLAASRLPLVGGLAADRAGLSAALALAERTGAVVDHSGAAALHRNLPAARETGWMVTTLSEVRNRCDLFLALGPDPATAFPRLAERALPVAPTLFSAVPLARPRLRIGPGAGAEGGIECPPGRLLEAVTLLRAVLGGRLPPSAARAGWDLAPFETLTERLRAATYPVLAWNAGAMDFPGADLVILGASEIVRDLNEKGRAAALPLGGAENLVGAAQIALWQAGYPLRHAYGPGGIEHDPRRFETARLLSSGEADALVWIAALRGEVTLPETAVPTILLAPPGLSLPREPDVFLPVGTPGIDHAGLVFRSDGVVSLPLRRLRETALPSVAQTLAAVIAALPGASS